MASGGEREDTMNTPVLLRVFEFHVLFVPVESEALLDNFVFTTGNQQR